MYYVWRIAAVCLTPATHSLCMRKKCQLRMQICVSKANIIACFSSTWENTTALFFFPPLRNKVGALRYPSVSKTVVCTVDIVFAAAASLLCYQRGVKPSAADYITLSKQRSRAQDLFFFHFLTQSVPLCVHQHNLSLHVSVAFIQINSNHRATLAESDDRLGD